MDIKSYISGKLVPELLRQKIICIEGADDMEFINIDSVSVNELTEAFALTKPYAVDVQLSRYSERDVKHNFNLVVKVKKTKRNFAYLNSDVSFFRLHRNVHLKFSSHVNSMFYSRMKKQHIKISYRHWEEKKSFQSELNFHLNFS